MTYHEQPMTDADHTAMAAPREKKARKLARYFGTPEAIVRRREAEEFFEASNPVTFPEPLPDE